MTGHAARMNGPMVELSGKLEGEREPTCGLAGGLMLP